MKLKEIIAKYHFNEDDFKSFLDTNNLHYSKSFLGGLSIDDSAVDNYISLYQDELKKRVEAEEAKRKAEEEKRKAAAEAREKARLEAKKRAEELAKKQAEERALREKQRKEAEAEAARKEAEAESLRQKQLIEFREEFEEAQKKEQAELENLTEDERKQNIMANCIKYYKEKLKGSWTLSGASYADGDIFGLWLREFEYDGTDGKKYTVPLTELKRNFTYQVYLTADECGNCYLCVNGNPNGFCSSFGKIIFTEKDDYFALSCKSSHFMFQRKYVKR